MSFDHNVKWFGLRAAFLIACAVDDLEARVITGGEAGALISLAVRDAVERGEAGEGQRPVDDGLSAAEMLTT